MALRGNKGVKRARKTNSWSWWDEVDIQTNWEEEQRGGHATNSTSRNNNWILGHLIHESGHEIIPCLSIPLEKKRELEAINNEVIFHVPPQRSIVTNPSRPFLSLIIKQPLFLHPLALQVCIKLPQVASKLLILIGIPKRTKLWMILFLLQGHHTFKKLISHSEKEKYQSSLVECQRGVVENGMSVISGVWSDSLSRQHIFQDFP